MLACAPSGTFRSLWTTASRCGEVVVTEQPQSGRAGDGRPPAHQLAARLLTVAPSRSAAQSAVACRWKGARFAQP
jgi:hypothetical protein